MKLFRACDCWSVVCEHNPEIPAKPKPFRMSVKMHYYGALCCGLSIMISAMAGAWPLSLWMCLMLMLNVRALVMKGRQ